MALFWIVHELDNGKRVVRIQAGNGMMLARLQARGRRLPQHVRRGAQLDAETTKKVPKKMVNRSLSVRDAEPLLKRIS